MQNTGPVKVFIGSGEASLLERKTLIYSLRKYTRRELDIYVYNGTHNAIEHNAEEPFLAPLPLKLKYRNRATEFALYRFIIPQLCGYQGKAIYLDSDMVCLADIGELYDTPLDGYNFLAKADAYSQIEDALWGLSVMLIDCERCRFDLEAIYREIDGGNYSYYDFSRMSRAFLQYHPYRIGHLGPRWNSFDYFDRETKLIHYTRLDTQPWKHPGHPYGSVWFAHFKEAIAAGYITQEDIELSILRSYVRQDIMSGNSAYRSIARQIKRQLKNQLKPISHP